MSCKLLSAWLLAGLLFTPLSAYGQRTQENNADLTEPESAGEARAASRLDLSRVTQQIVTATNEFRRRHHRQPLKINPALAKAAHYFADYMARTDKYGHTADGHEPWERAQKYGYNYCVMAENIGYIFNSEGFTAEQLARDLTKGWEHSPPHRKNMLDPDLTEIGVAVAHSQHTGRYYAVQDFGRPKSKAIAFKVVNRTDAAVKYTVDGKPFTIEPHYIITHERCRPPKLDVQLPQKSPSTATTERVFHPTNGARYVITRDRSGTFQIDQG